MFSVLFAIILILSVTSQTSGKEYEYWRNCVQDSHCQRPLVCWNNKCVCPVGRLWNEPFCENITSSKCDNYKNEKCRDTDENRICDEKTKRCLCRDQTVEDPKDRLCKLVKTQCKSDIDCKSKDSNSTCDQTKGECKCLPSFYYDFKVKLCRPKIDYFKECNYHYQCQTSMLCQRFSNYGFCQCPIGYRWSKVDKVCQPTNLTVRCTVDNDCRGPATDGIKICVSATCQCPTGYRLNSYGNCTQGASRDIGCQLNSDCKTNLTCDYTNVNNRGYCKCDFGYQWSEINKKCLLFSEARCERTTDCIDKEIDSICDNQKCTCKNGKLELSKEGKCQLKMPACGPSKACPALSNSFCNHDLKKNQCTCKQSMDLSRTDDSCFPKRCNAENPCHSDDYSNDKNMYCKDDGFCDCKHGVDHTGRCNQANVLSLGFLLIVFYIITQSLF